MHWEIGNTLYFVAGGRYVATGTVTITKVGRKWLKLSNGCRVDVEDLTADGGKYTSPGKCYLNKTAHDMENEVKKVWKELYSRLGYNLPTPTLTLAKIDQIRKILEL